VAPRSAGRDDQFDVDRFGEWLEVLVETGESVAARTVAALDPQLVVAGLSRYVRVFDPGTFEPTEQSDDEAMDRHDRMNSETSRGVSEYEVGGYLVRARRADAWDAIISLLGALETEQADCFRAVMQGCRRLSNSTPEIDGLDDLLLAPEQQLHDAAIEREERRSRRVTRPPQTRAPSCRWRGSLARPRRPRSRRPHTTRLPRRTFARSKRKPTRHQPRVHPRLHRRPRTRCGPPDVGCP
jgi:hypothetical protein